MAENQIHLTKRDRSRVIWRSMLLQGSWNYERIQDGSWAYSLIPTLRKLYPGKKDLKDTFEGHSVLFNTHPYLTSPILGIALALEEEKASGKEVEDQITQGVKVSMMGPLAGVGDLVFWHTVWPIMGSLGVSLAAQGSILGPILFFIVWNLIRIAFLWYSQESGYRVGFEITKDLSGGLMSEVTRGASMMDMLVLGALIERWVSIKFLPVVSKSPLQKGAYIDWNSLPKGAKGIQQALIQWHNQGLSLTNAKVTILQDDLDSLIPGLAALCLTFLCMWLSRRKVSPITIVIGIFIVGIAGHVVGLL